MAWWWPVATSRQLDRTHPLARVLHGRPLVLFRDASGRPAALPDRCPHRFAPLSAGRVCEGALECPYHGWRFDAAGHCTRAPGSLQARSDSALLQPLRCQETHGLIWVTQTAPANPLALPAATDDDQPLDLFWMHQQLRCSLLDAAENFLDAFHTHFVHAGWVRRDARRQAVLAQVQALPDGVQARYSEEGLQAGLLSRLFEGSRGESFGRFRLPGLAEIEYRNRDGELNLLISAWLTPGADGELQVIARIATRRGWLPASLKKMLLKPLFWVVLGQDKRILERISAQSLQFAQCDEPFGPQRRLDGRQDLLGPHIRQLLEAGRLDAFEPYSLQLQL